MFIVRKLKLLLVLLLLYIHRESLWATGLATCQTNLMNAFPSPIKHLQNYIIYIMVVLGELDSMFQAPYPALLVHPWLTSIFAS